jgi:DNA-binding transcriptional regulator LsrR (DeoR family)
MEEPRPTLARLGNRVVREHSSARGPDDWSGRLDSGRTQRQERKLDQAARAAWLYYVGGNTQDEIAGKLNVSRQAAQRLVSLAVAEKLIKFRLDHPLAAAVALGEALRERFGLAHCAVEPMDPAAASPTAGIAIGAAEYLGTFLAQREPLVLAFATGRTLRALVGEVAATAPSPQHKLVSLVGAVSREGRASQFEVVMRLAERTGAQCFPMPTPVVASTVEERRLLQTQRSYVVIRELALRAAVAFVGVSQVGPGSPLHHDRFITDDELTELMARGAVGEVAGWAFDEAGRLIEGATNERVAGLPLSELGGAGIVAVAGGPNKVGAIRAALSGRLVSGLITDERTAAAVLAGDRAPFR